MIITNLLGGLGNQLFQYAAGYSLAKKKSTDFYCYTKNMDHYPKWDINLDKIFPISQIRSCPLDTQIFQEIDFSYSDINLINKGKNFFLNGYFQSWKYSDPYIKELRELYYSTVIIKPSIIDFYNELQYSNSLFFHIRRGDYIKFKDVHFNIPVENIIDVIKSRLETSEVQIVCGFSDDTEIIDLVFNEIKYSNIVKVNASKFFNSQLDEFILMTACRDSIIANSSFSWWAAHLNYRKDKFVTRPKTWFSDPNMNIKTTYLSPPDWIGY
jgi:hypothetical protein